MTLTSSGPPSVTSALCYASPDASSRARWSPGAAASGDERIIVRIAKTAPISITAGTLDDDAGVPDAGPPVCVIDAECSDDVCHVEAELRARTANGLCILLGTTRSTSWTRSSSSSSSMEPYAMAIAIAAIVTLRRARSSSGRALICAM